MSRKFLILLMVVLSFTVFGCTKAVTPALNSVEISQTDFSNVDSLKHGTACASYLFGLIGPFGDPKLVEAVKDANIKTVKVVDYSNKNFLIITQQCIEVYGE